LPRSRARMAAYSNMIVAPIPAALVERAYDIVKG
jgi:hypothetical protein